MISVHVLEKLSKSYISYPAARSCRFIAVLSLSPLPDRWCMVTPSISLCLCTVKKLHLFIGCRCPRHKRQRAICHCSTAALARARASVPLAPALRCHVAGKRPSWAVSRGTPASVLAEPPWETASARRAAQRPRKSSPSSPPQHTPGKVHSAAPRCGAGRWHHSLHWPPLKGGATHMNSCALSISHRGRFQRPPLPSLDILTLEKKRDLTD